MDHAGKVAIITGSTSGIGLAIAHAFAKSGIKLAIHGLLSPAEGEALCGDLRRQYGATARYYGADLRDPEAIARTVQSVTDDFGGIDILVNNAGMQHVSPIESFSPNAWNDMIAVNLSAPFHAIRLCLPSMRSRGWGRIVNIASISGLRGRAGKSAYNATKHGLIGLTKSVAIETADTPITCNAICPGWALTPIVQKQIDALAERESIDQQSAAHRLISLRQPSGKPVKIAHLAAMVVFLCSDEAEEVRGAAWTMDGGTTAL